MYAFLHRARREVVAQAAAEVDEARVRVDASDADAAEHVQRSEDRRQRFLEDVRTFVEEAGHDHTVERVAIELPGAALSAITYHTDRWRGWIPR